MSRTIHINLLKRAEYRSCMPIRIRVMAPILLGFVLFVVVLAAGTLHWRSASIQTGLADIRDKRRDLESAQNEYLELKARERAALEEWGQFTCFLESRLVFGGLLTDLPTIVPDQMQLTQLQITLPVRPVVAQAAARRRASGARRGAAAAAEPVERKTTVVETTQLKVSGLVDSSRSVDLFKEALLSERFTNLVVGVDIPPGAFKVSPGRVNQYVFEVIATFKGRVFE